jgi:hypothetical protein
LESKCRVFLEIYGINVLVQIQNVKVKLVILLTIQKSANHKPKVLVINIINFMQQQNYVILPQVVIVQFKQVGIGGFMVKTVKNQYRVAQKTFFSTFFCQALIILDKVQSCNL